MASEYASAPSTRCAFAGRGAARALRDRIETWLEAERDQLPLWLPVGLGLGVAAWFVLSTATAWAGFVLAAAGLAAGFASLSAGGRAERAAAAFALAAAIGCALVWWRAERVAAPVLARPVVARFDATVERVEPQPAREAVRVVLMPDTAAGLPPRVRVNFKLDEAPAGLAPGARLRLRARLMPPPSAAVPGAYDFARVAWFQRLGATGRAFAGAEVIPPPASTGAAVRLAAVRARLNRHIQGRLEGAEGGIASAFVTGDTGAIPEPDAEAMRRSGLAHLLSISGLHVTAVTAAAMLVALRLLALSPWLALRAPLPVIAAGAGAAAALGYTLLSGSEVPTVRSCIAAMLVLLALALGREAVTLRLVAAGAIAVLLLWPEALVGPSFQLSFAAITAIVALHEHPVVAGWFVKRDEPRVRRWAREAGSLFLTGIAVELALMPIALFHFHRAGLYGAAANIVAIPLSTFVIMPLEAGALLLDAGGLGAPLWWACGKAVALLLWIARTVAAMPGATRMVPSMPGGAFALMVAGGLWLALWRTRARRLGLAPLAAGAMWTLVTPPPDLLVTSDGRHVAIRTADGGLALLRDRAGDYVRDMLGEGAGVAGDAAALDSLPGARCGPDLCVVTLSARGRAWRLLATRSPYLVDARAMNRACAAADIVVSERRLPRGCTPRWLKADRAMLARTGGLAIRLDPPGVVAAADEGDHPWSRAAPRSGNDRGRNAVRSRQGE